LERQTKKLGKMWHELVELSPSAMSGTRLGEGENKKKDRELCNEL